MHFRLEFQYSFDEFKEAQQAHLNGGRKINYGRGLIGWIVFVALAVAFYWVMKSESPSPPPPGSTPTGDVSHRMLLPLLPWVLIFGCIWFFIYRTLRSRFQTMWENQRGLHAPRVVEVTAEGMSTATGSVTTAYKWDAFERHFETPNLFVLNSSKYAMEILPKRAFQASADVDAFREFLTHAISPRQSAFPVLPPVAK